LQRTLDWSGHASQHAPIRAELECHNDPGDDTEPECDTKDLEPELEHLPVGRTPGPQMQRLKHGKPRRQPDRKGWEDNVE